MERRGGGRGATVVRVKICGVTTPEGIAAADDAGADAVGVNFYAKSPRFVEPRAALALLAELPPLMAGVGVWVEQPPRQAFALSHQLGLRGVQWYGDPAAWEPAAPFSLVPAFRVRDAADLAMIDAALQTAAARGVRVSAVLVDSFVAGSLGGTGHVAPWDLLAGWRPAVPLILAGGLTPGNVAEAVRRVRPAAVDVASGVESSPGVKDRAKVRDFVQAAKGALA